VAQVCGDYWCGDDPTPLEDWYRVAAGPGDRLEVEVIDYSIEPTIVLFDNQKQSLATASIDNGFRFDYDAFAFDGDYFLRVTKPGTADATLYTFAAYLTTDQPRWSPLSQEHRFEAMAGDVLTIEALAPASDWAAIDELLTPRIELLGPGSAVEPGAVAAPDANGFARLQGYVAQASGGYTVRIVSEDYHLGAYAVHVAGAGVPPPPLLVAAASPADGEAIPHAVDRIDLSFVHQIDVSSLEATDVLVDELLVSASPLSPLVRTVSLDGLSVEDGDVDRFTVDLQPGETLTALLTGKYDAVVSVAALDPQQMELASATGSTGLLLQPVRASAAGTYTVVVATQDDVYQSYKLELIVDGALENEQIEGPRNDTAEQAHDLADVFVPLDDGSAEHAVVLGSLTLPGATEDFEGWWGRAAVREVPAILARHVRWIRTGVRRGRHRADHVRRRLVSIHVGRRPVGFGCAARPGGRRRHARVVRRRRAIARYGHR